MGDDVVWVDGVLRAPGEAAVGALDRGLLLGHGVFETCAVVDGRAFALTRHLRRLARSARALGLGEPDLDAVRAGIAAVLAGRPDLGRLRITVTAGAAPLGWGPADGRQTVVVAAARAGRGATTARAVRVPWVRNERSPLVGLKTTSYAENVLAAARARELGADEALLANTRGELCEGAVSNVFVELADDGALVTPPLSSGCLPGVTRELVLEWSQAAGLPVREGTLGWEVLDEVADGRGALALSGSVRGLAPVVALDGAPLAPLPLTAEVAALYRRRAAEDVDP